MKKLLGVATVCVLSLVCATALASCKKGDDNGLSDADAAKDVITNVKAMYLEKPAETAADYTVIGQAKDSAGTTHNITWSVSSEFNNYSDYLSVGDMDEQTKLVTVSVKKATEAIDYKLTASVTVGKATESISFNRTVPAGKDRGDAEMTTTTISFASDNCSSYTPNEQQIFEDGDVKVTNDRGSGTAIPQPTGSYAKFYKGSELKIEFPGMINLVFHSTALVGTSDYPTNLYNTLKAAYPDAEVTINGEDITIELSGPVNVLEFTLTGGQARVYSIDIEAYADGASDEQIVAFAKSVFNLTETNFNAVGEYSLPDASSGASISWSVTSDYVSITDDGKLSIDSMPEEDTNVTLTATFKSGSVTDTKEFTITLIAGFEHDGSEESPYTAEEAIKATLMLPANTTSSSSYYVEGYVINIATYSTSYGYNLYIADSADAALGDEGVFYVYGLTGGDLTGTNLSVGDYLVMNGKLQHYVSSSGTVTPELYNPTCVTHTSIYSDMTDEDKVEAALDGITLSRTEYEAVSEYALPTTSVTGVTLTWTIEENDYASINDGKLNIAKLPTDNEVTLTLTLKAESGEVSDTKTFEITVATPEAFEVGDYVISFNHKNLNKTFYFTGELSGNFGATTEDLYSAAVITVAQADGGYTLKINGGANDGKYLECGYYSATSGNYLFNETPTGVWVYDYALEVFTWTVADKEGVVYYLGMTGTYNTINLRNASTISGANSGAAGSTEFPGRYEKYEGDTRSDAEKVEYVQNNVQNKLDNLVTTYREAGTVNLPASNVEDVEIVWSSESDLVTFEGNVMTIVSIPEDETKITVKATITCGDETDYAEIEITLTSKLDLAHEGTEADPFSAADVLTIFETLAAGKYYTVSGEEKLVYIEGYVTLIEGTKSTNGFSKVYIADEAGAAKADSVYVFTVNFGVVPSGEDLKLGDKLVVSGYLYNWSGTYEVMQSSAKVYPEIVSIDYVASTDAEKVDLALSDTLLPASATEDIPFPEAFGRLVGVEYSFEVKTETNAIVVDAENKELKVTRPDSEEVSVTITVTASIGGESKSKDYTVKVEPNVVYWTKATTANFEDGTKIVLVAALTNGTLSTMGTQYTGATPYRYSENGFSVNSKTNVIEITLEKVEDGVYRLYVGDDANGIKQYLCAVSGKNALSTGALPADNTAAYDWTISIDNGYASITSKVSDTENRTIYYNSGSPRFACYTAQGSMTQISIYVSAE